MGKQYLIDELPEEFRDNEYDMGIPVGVYFNPKTSGLVIQVVANAMPTIWALGGWTPEEAPEPLKKSDIPVPKKVVIGDRSIDTRPVGYPIDDVVKLITAART